MDFIRYSPHMVTCWRLISASSVPLLILSLHVWLILTRSVPLPLLASFVVCLLLHAHHTHAHALSHALSHAHHCHLSFRVLLLHLWVGLLHHGDFTKVLILRVKALPGLVELGG